MSRRADRPAQVRPRPPAGSRSPGPRARPRQRTSGRLPTHRNVREPLALPMPVRILLAAAVVALAAVVLVGAVGGFGQVAAGIGGVFGGFVDRITATPSPSPTAPVEGVAPSLVAPDEPYTNRAAIDVVAQIPQPAVGRGSTVRLYLALEGQAPAPIAELPIGASSRVVFAATELTPGLNRFSATIVRGAVESQPSPTIDYILDQEPPAIVVASPENGATLNRSAATIEGSTQPRSTVQLWNEAASTGSTVTAAADGRFSGSVALQPGPNGIRISATDPAGNTNEYVISILRGSGALTAELTASAYRIKATDLPRDLELAVTAIDPDGRPLAQAEVTFTLQIPGLQPTVASAVTAGDGTASFRTTIPAGAMTGSGLAAVLVEGGEFGQARSQVAITIE